MEVSIKDKPVNKIFNRDNFIPFTVTFDINTKEEAKRFHDNVAIKAAQGPSEFIAQIYRRCNDRARATLRIDNYTDNI